MPQPGFVLGQNFLFGSAAGCQAVQSSNIVTISKRFKRYMDPNLLTKNAPIEVNYRMVYAEHQSPHQIQVEFELNKVKQQKIACQSFDSTISHHFTKCLLFFNFIIYICLANASHRFVSTEIVFK